MPSWFSPVMTRLAALLDLVLGHSAFDRRREQRRRVVTTLLCFLSLVVLVFAYRLGKLAAATPPEGSPAWDAAMASRVAEIRSWWVDKLACWTLLETYLTFALLDRTPLGKRLWHWSLAMDSDASAAAKTLSAGLFFAVALLAFAWLNGRVLP